MTRRRWTLAVDLEEPGLVIVRGWRAGDILRDAGLRALWSGSRRAWTLDERRAPDVLAAIEASGAAVVVVGRIRTPEPAPVQIEPDPQLGLWEAS